MNFIRRNQLTENEAFLIDHVQFLVVNINDSNYRLIDIRAIFGAGKNAPILHVNYILHRNLARTQVCKRLTDLDRILLELQFG